LFSGGFVFFFLLKTIRFLIFTAFRPFSGVLSFFSYVDLGQIYYVFTYTNALYSRKPMGSVYGFLGNRIISDLLSYFAALLLYAFFHLKTNGYEGF
jgi:hypothetical protein